MKIHRIVIGITLLLAVICVSLPAGLAAQETTGPELGLSLLKLGEPKPGAVDLHVSVNTPPQGFYSPGDRVIITLDSPRDAFLSVVHVSDSGDLLLLYPEKDKGENGLPAGEKQVLFGDKANAHLIAGKEMEKGGTIAYLSPRQFNLSLMRFFRGGQWMEIPGGEERDLKLIKEKLDIISADKGFNRVVIPIKGKSGKNCSLTISKQGRALTRQIGMGR